MNESNPTPDANPEQERLLDLLADHALGELSPAELQEMNTLLEGHPELQDDALEEAAALLLVAEVVGRASSIDDELPVELSEKLAADAQRFVGPQADHLSFSEGDSALAISRRPRILAFVGGAVGGAVAASVLMAVILSVGPFRQPGSLIGTATPADEAYDRYVQSVPDAATYPWAITEAGYEQVTGEVVWSGQTQNGYMVLDGLPVNDPDEAQYQLWIVDPTRDAFPVDGGVFNVAGHVGQDGKAYVPIDAKLRVDQPAAFAITLEKPGGVVKSNNALLVVAAVE